MASPLEASTTYPILTISTNQQKEYQKSLQNLMGTPSLILTVRKDSESEGLGNHTRAYFCPEAVCCIHSFLRPEGHFIFAMPAGQRPASNLLLFVHKVILQGLPFTQAGEPELPGDSYATAVRI